MNGRQNRLTFRYQCRTCDVTWNTDQDNPTCWQCEATGRLMASGNLAAVDTDYYHGHQADPATPGYNTLEKTA